MKSGRQKLKKFLAFVMTAVMVLTAVPFGGLTFSASAEDEGYYTYTVENGEATITDCDESISGEVVIPDTLGGYPVTSIGDDAFFDCTGLTSITIPDSVTSIGDWAFGSCTGLTNITIPDSVTSIGYRAFDNCTGLTSITVSSGNTVYHSTDNCLIETESKTLILGCKSSVIPSNGSVTSIGDYAFRGCTGLTSITIPDGVTSIGDSAFSDCIGLTSIIIPDSVTSIGDSAFSFCASLTSITIPDGVTNIGDLAFYYCTGLTYIEVPNSVTSIGDWAFCGCTGLASITIPDSVVNIGWLSFSGCTGLTSITIPRSVTSIGHSAFSDCTGLTKITVSSDNTVYHSTDNCLIETESKTLILGCKSSIIPTDGSVTSIGETAFWGCTGLTKLTIPDIVTNIGWGVFCDCSNLTSVIISKSVTSIEEATFSGCSGLTNITIPDSVTSIGERAFAGCTNLTKITIPDSVTSIERSAFDNTACYNNNSNWEDDVLYIGNHLIKAKDSIFGEYDIKCGTITIADHAFFACTGLTSITIPNSVMSIGNYAFSGCTGLTSITIPDSVTSIGDDAYYDTAYYNNDSNWENDVLYIGNHLIKAKTSISGVYSIKDGTKTIADDAFSNCSGLTSVTIPDSVTNISDRAFYHCTGLTSITIPDSVTSIGDEAFEDCTGLTSITIPDSVTSIGEYAFAWCESLTSITIPDSVTSIGDSAFFRCTSLTSITVSTGNTVYHSTDNCLIETESKTLILGCKNSIIPSDGSVTSIGYEAFYNCSGLTSITIPDSVTSIGDCAFIGCTGLTSVTIGNSVTSIGEEAFAHCTGLKSITIPASVTDIGNKAFGYYFDESTDEVKKVENFTIYGYTGTAAETYANENGFAFIALDEEHTHTYSAWAVITEPTCTAEGEETRTCSVCGATETRPVEKKAHDLNNVKIDSTCTVAGVSYDVCSECQQTFNYVTLPLAAHTFGEWTVTKEATAFEFGEKVRVCSVCGFEEKAQIEKLPVSEVKDEKTGISVVCPDGSYDGEVEIEVSEVFDGTSYNILNAEKGNFKNALFDITTVIDGEKVQPNGSVFVKIPLPDGYNAEKTVVYYITNDGRLEKMDSRVEDGYIVFETTHFSFYAIVDETEKQPENPSENCSCACHKGGIAKLFFKIKLFFQKIFKKNRVCKCGVNHY